MSLFSKSSSNSNVPVDDVCTLNSALPLLPSLVAVIDALPFATAVTNPELETVATDVLLEFHVIDRPVRTLPAESRAVAVACVV